MSSDFAFPRLSERTTELPIDDSPIADFEHQSDGLLLRLFDLSAAVEPKTIVAWKWDFGQFPTANFSYVQAGTPARTINFTDTSVPVSGSPIVAWYWEFNETRPTARFTHLPAGLTVQFTDASTDVAPGTIVSRSWNFGDGTTSVLTSPSKTYAASGTYNVTLTVTDNDGLTGTTTSLLGVSVTGTGRPFGAYNILIAPEAAETVGVQYFNADHSYASPSALVRRINYARRYGWKLVITIPGNSHAPWLRLGKFDITAWEAGVDTFNTPANIEAVRKGVEDGTILCNNLFDEPSHKSWGGVFELAPPNGGKALLDRMARKVKSVFPTLPCFVAIVHWWHNGHTYSQGTTPLEYYTDVDGIMSMFDWWQSPNGPQGGQSGNIIGWVAAAKAVAASNNISLILMMNIVDGGIQSLKADAKTVWPCPTDLSLDPITARTGGRGTQAPRCRHTPEQTEYWGKKLVEGGSALMMWRYDDVQMSSRYQAAYAAIDALADTLPVGSYRRTA